MRKSLRMKIKELERLKNERDRYILDLEIMRQEKEKLMKEIQEIKTIINSLKQDITSFNN